ncbi:MAG: AAA family ATPase [Acidimicrobiia bacterium]
MSSPLDGAVDDFVRRMTAAVDRLAPPTATTAADVALDAANICAALIDADGRLTDDELWAWIAAFGPRLDTSLSRATPAELRKTAVIKGTAPRLRTPGALLELLLAADARDAGRRAIDYYETALHLAHTTASIDLVPSPDELAAIDGFRVTMLQAMDRAGVTRPGALRPSPVEAPGPPGHPPEPASAAELKPPRPLTELMAELDGLIGLGSVKAEIRLVADLIQVQRLRESRQLPIVETTRHLVFSGNPGTGKTTVARLLSEIYRTLGVVDKGHLVETDRSGLVAGYVGQTATKTRAVVEEAIGGTLLIDEAYALARGNENDFGKEAIDTLVKMMEDHRHDLVIIAAGYTLDMAEFIAANAGLRSRFPKTIDFPDYSDDELIEIFQSLGKKQRYTPDENAVAKLRSLLASEIRDRGFGNARLVRNLFEAAIARQAGRIMKIASPSDHDLTTLVADDVPDATAGL